MATPRDPVNIPARENLDGGDETVPPTTPGDSNPDLDRPSMPGPLPDPDAEADDDS